METESNLVAFIPARSNSRRIPGKNIRPFFGHPLLAYAIQGAQDSGLFDGGIYVSTDADDIAAVAVHYGARVLRRPPETATDTSPDAEWIAHALAETGATAYAILRPTSPFRTGDTIRRAFAAWDTFSHLKAVERVHQHPGKMWRVAGRYMVPLWDGGGHLCQTNTLPAVYVQNASLEWRTAGVMDSYQPFLTEGYEGFDLNTPDDWMLGVSLVQRGLASPPRIERSPYAI